MGCTLGTKTGKRIRLELTHGTTQNAADCQTMNGIQVDVGLERLIQGAVLQPCQVNQQTDILCTLAG